LGPGGRFNRLRQEIDDLLYAEIQARQGIRDILSPAGGTG